ncbi:hypothetical protein R6Q57_022667 [Mikania cordata]
MFWTDKIYKIWVQEEMDMWCPSFDDVEESDVESTYDESIDEDLEDEFCCDDFAGVKFLVEDQEAHAEKGHRGT